MVLIQTAKSGNLNKILCMLKVKLYYKLKLLTKKTLLGQ